MLYLHSMKGKTQNNSARSAETPTRKIGNSSHHICVVLREVRFAKDSEPPAAVSLIFCCSRDVFVHVFDHQTVAAKRHDLLKFFFAMICFPKSLAHDIACYNSIGITYSDKRPTSSSSGEHSQQPCRRRGCFRSEECCRRSNSTFVFVLAFSACVEGETSHKSNQFDVKQRPRP